MWNKRIVQYNKSSRACKEDRNSFTFTFNIFRSYITYMRIYMSNRCIHRDQVIRNAHKYFVDFKTICQVTTSTSPQPIPQPPTFKHHHPPAALISVPRHITISPEIIQQGYRSLSKVLHSVLPIWSPESQDSIFQRQSAVQGPILFFTIFE